MRLLPVMLLAAAPVVAQPLIKGVLNNYSYTLPGLPNYGIAQGSIFIVSGTGLANGSTGLQTSYPLPTNLLGTTLSVTVNGATTVPILYYVLPTQIAAILPAATPVGTGIITVSNNGQTSAVFPIQVVQSAFGILTYYGGGSGFAAVFDDNFPSSASPYVTLSSSANPGDVLTVWGSGIGPDPGNPNEAILQTPHNLAGTLPIEVDIGGMSATILYAGRSTYPGLDQINVSVPANVTPGCHVSLMVKIGNYVSNSTTFQVAASGSGCSDPNIGYTAAQLQKLTGQSTINVGIVGFGRTNSGSAVTNGLNAYFNAYSLSQFLTQAQSASYGSCVIIPTMAAPPYLDAGPAIKVTGPGGETGTIDKTSASIYFGGLSTSFIPDTGGAFTFSNGTGGGNVGPFAGATTTIPAEVTWTNASSIGSISRSQGLTVNWTGGTANAFVVLRGTAATVDGSVTQEFECAAGSNAGKMSVPGSVLLAMPANTGQLALVTYALPVSFTAAGMDAGFVVAEINTVINVSYR